MIRFNINGEYLDLPDDISVQFKKSNILFAFDNIECERSTSFDIPATPQNNRIFSLAKCVQMDGEGMRRRYEAQMQAGLVTQDGYLHIDQYDSGRYKAVFVTGELLGLKRLKDAGKISDIITPTETAIFGVNQSPYIGKSSAFLGVMYDASGGAVVPSVRLQTIIDRAMQAVGVQWTAPTTSQYLRFIPQQASGVKSQSATFTGISHPMSTATYPVAYEIGISAATEVLLKTTARVRTEERATGGGVTARLGLAQQYTARQPLQLSFPSDWDDDLFVGYFVNGDSALLSEFQFYGGRSFDDTGAATGESLRGRTVDVARGAYFTIIDKRCFVNEPYSGGTLYGWSFVNAECEFEIEGGEMEAQSVLRLVDNLPDATVTDLLKIFAATSGKLLYYSDINGVTFDDLDLSAFDTFDLTGKVIATKDVRRTFGDYAQRNVIEFESGESVPAAVRITQAYTIDNDNLQEEKSLLKIKYSEGKSAGAYGARTYAQVPEGVAAIADADVPNGGSGMFRVALAKNAGLQALLDASTSVQIQALLTLLEFNQITPKTALYYAGVRYVWTEAQWANGVATLKVSKILA